MRERRVELYDTTLRDGSQMEGISFSLEDKLKITEKLDEFGIHYIEGGWPGSNPKDIEYFRAVKDLPLENAEIAAFGSTRRPRVRAEEDANLNALVDSEAPIATIFGKSWDLHVTRALKTTLENNLQMIAESIEYLREHGMRVFYDAEHFFDGYRANPEYAITTIKVAEEAGAERIVLADTNGGSLPSFVKSVVEKVKEEIKTPLGIHAHNDSELAVANSLMAFEAGVIQIQGTINGYGERCGNANLISIIPALELKYGVEVVGRERLKKLKELAHFVAELANMEIPRNQPYVGDSAFAHKGGVHVSAVLKDPRTYEHIPPEAVGNRRKVVVSELSGRSNLIYKAKELGIDINENDPKLQEVVKKIKELEFLGYHFEAAEASLELLIKKVKGEYTPTFELERAMVVSEILPDHSPISEATVVVKVGDKKVHTAAEGNGPVNALDLALRKALSEFYPELKKISLVDYKVRVLGSEKGTAAKVRVLIQTSDGRRTWGTVGVSTNIIEASLNAIIDSMEYWLMKGRENK
ncbi:citramalate synthase [Pyrococcus furiosus DSM 3638]|uniref:Citramalate synthase n=3 Tax=Pyrococcus furiosus TaxID=2261 RepID=A0A5C0XNQ5_PYRFU|nr:MULTISPECIES: citramalate synthase [Pyrococcus]AAL81065.1 leua homolog alpha-isopropylmalate synthase related [Pyrococcus furiosus DSM 3638]AFN03734.1 alpha-isopropylmalate/homocitrate synthase family transferase [Pyrococcus furiosus COM1]MDK2869718.1 2-isopropylmalate synthase [Pyrococcus sp.]QEK78607.1 citramalate synthase [Pyrococcus furiosus DSM 3638]